LVELSWLGQLFWGQLSWLLVSWAAFAATSGTTGATGASTTGAVSDMIMLKFNWSLYLI